MKADYLTYTEKRYLNADELKFLKDIKISQDKYFKLYTDKEEFN